MGKQEFDDRFVVANQRIVIKFELLKERIIANQIFDRIFKQRNQMLEGLPIGTTVFAGVTNVIEGNSIFLSDRCGIGGGASTRVMKDAQFGHAATLAHPTHFPNTRR